MSTSTLSTLSVSATGKQHQSGALPAIVAFGYEGYVVENKRRKASCKFCRTKIQEAEGTTSSFIKHIRNKHIAEFNKYQQTRSKSKSSSSSKSQSGTLDYFLVSEKFGRSHPKQCLFNHALLDELIVGCGLPLSICENPHFRKFMSAAEPKWSPVSRTTIRGIIPQKVQAMETRIKHQLASIDYVSTTVDIWSDRVMRGYLGITAHYITDEANTFQLRSCLLGCHRFDGSHTGQRISDEFENVCRGYSFVPKLDFIVTDNAANMKKAFSVCFPEEVAVASMSGTSAAAEDDLSLLDDPSLWTETQECLDDVVEFHAQNTRLACFTHSLQLVIADGLKNTNMVSLTIGKCSKLCSLLHNSCAMKEAFEEAFGANKSIPADVVTRWNSTYRQLKAIMEIDFCALNEVLRARSPNFVFTPKEWSQLHEIVTLLHPFAQATDATQGEKVVTCSLVVPCVFSLYKHCKLMGDSLRFLKRMDATLRDSLISRFKGVFVNTRMAKTSNVDEVPPFNNDVYLISAVLDPKFKLRWIDADVDLNDEEKEDLKLALRNLVIDKAKPRDTAKKSSPRAGSDDQEIVEYEPESQLPPLFSYTKRAKPSCNQNRPSPSIKSPSEEYVQYIESEESVSDPLEFWSVHRSKYPLLAAVAKRYLTVPASSSPVERVFSYGGIIMRPHRASMSDEMLSNLIFLKCNLEMLH